MRVIFYLLPFVAVSGAAAQELRSLDPRLHPAPEEMLSGYLQRIATRQLDERRAQVEAIRNKEEYEQRKTRLRAAALRMLAD